MQLDAIGKIFAVAKHQTRMGFYSPQAFIPPLILPLCGYAVFAGGLSRLEDLPGFNYAQGYTTFAFAFTLVMAAAFAGSFTGLAAARSFELGFNSRMLLGVGRGDYLAAGFFLAAWARGAVGIAIVTAIAAATGCSLPQSPVEVTLLAVLVFAVIGIGACWGIGVAWRMRSLDASPAIQVPIIVLLFATPAVLPSNLLSPWFGSIAAVNPATPVVVAVRDLLAGGMPAASGLVATGVLLLMAGAWAAFSSRTLK